MSCILVKEYKNEFTVSKVRQILKDTVSIKKYDADDAVNRGDIVIVSEADEEFFREEALQLWISCICI